MANVYNAFNRAVGNAAQEADKLRFAVNAGTTGHELETRVACFVLAAAQVRNRFEEMDTAEAEPIDEEEWRK